MKTVKTNLKQNSYYWVTVGFSSKSEIMLCTLNKNGSLILLAFDGNEFNVNDKRIIIESEIKQIN